MWRVVVAVVLVVLAWLAWGFDGGALFGVGMMVGLGLAAVEWVPEDNDDGR